MPPKFASNSAVGGNSGSEWNTQAANGSGWNVDNSSAPTGEAWGTTVDQWGSNENTGNNANATWGAPASNNGWGSTVEQTGNDTAPGWDTTQQANVNSAVAVTESAAADAWGAPAAASSDINQWGSPAAAAESAWGSPAPGENQWGNQTTSTPAPAAAAEAAWGAPAAAENQWGGSAAAATAAGGDTWGGNAAPASNDAWGGADASDGNAWGDNGDENNGGVGGWSSGGAAEGGQPDRLDINDQAVLDQTCQDLDESRQEGIRTYKFIAHQYKEHPDVTAWDQSEVDAWRNEQKIRIVSLNDARDVNDVPKPIRTFEQAGFNEAVTRAIESQGFEEPRAIQAQGWPVIYSGRDTIGIAPTGSGKTVAYLLPAIMHCLCQKVVDASTVNPVVLIIAPTRELAQQIYQEAKVFTEKAIHKAEGMSDADAMQARVKCGLVTGGMGFGGMMAEAEGAGIIICTPGRLVDLIVKRKFYVHRVTYLVLDEADKLLEGEADGFAMKIRMIGKFLRPDRQTLMWSATWNDEVKALAQEMCKEDPVFIYVKGGNIVSNKVIQHIRFVPSGHANNLMNPAVVMPKEGKFAHKVVRLCGLVSELMESFGSVKILVICNTKQSATDVGDLLRLYAEHRQYIKTDAAPEGCTQGAVHVAHGDCDHNANRDATRYFRACVPMPGAMEMLISTEMLGRGIDLPDLMFMVNFDAPKEWVDYVHRVGRVGRQIEGHAFTFITDDSKEESIRQAIANQQSVDTTCFPMKSREVLSNLALAEPSPLDPREGFHLYDACQAYHGLRMADMLAEFQKRRDLERGIIGGEGAAVGNWSGDNNNAGGGNWTGGNDGGNNWGSDNNNAGGNGGGWGAETNNNAGGGGGWDTGAANNDNGGGGWGNDASANNGGWDTGAAAGGDNGWGNSGGDQGGNNGWGNVDSGNNGGWN